MSRRKNVSKNSRVRKVFGVCIIRNPSIPTSQIILFQNIQGTQEDEFDQLISICDKCLREPIESPYRTTVYFAQIPSSINDTDLISLGYHKQCYTDFIKYLNFCQADQSSIENEEVKYRSPRRRKSTDTLFPAECVFCERKKKRYNNS